MEELGDARLRCDQLMRYLDEAVQLIEKSDKKDHFFEVAGHLIQGIPETAFKLEKALQAVALAADRIDYEELKQELRPEKVEELERVLKDVRIRPVKHRSENPMKPKEAAARLREFAKITREEGSLPLHDVAAFIADLGRTRQASETPVADTFDRMATVLESGQSVSRQELATVLYRMAGEAEVETALRLASKPRFTQEHMQLGNAEEVKKKFKAENPDITDEQLSEIAEQWTKNKDVVKDKTALEPGDAEMPAHFETIRTYAIAGSRAASAFRWRPALMNLYYIVDEIGTILVKLGSMDTQKSEGLKREIRQQLPQAAHNIEEMAPMSVLAAEADISKLYHEMSAHLDSFDLSWSRYEKNPEGNKAKLADALRYMKALRTVADVVIRNLESKTAAKTAAEDLQPRSVPEVSQATEHMLDSARKATAAAGQENWKKVLFHTIGVIDGAYLMGNIFEVPEVGYLMRARKGFVSYSGARPTTNFSASEESPWKTEDAAGEEAKRSRFEDGKPADPTQNMDPEDADKWKTENDEHKDNFKAAKRDTHLEGKSGHTMCGEEAHKDTIVKSPRDATCYYCKQAWEKKHASSKTALGPDGGGTLSKFEEGKPADPTENMSPEDAKRWKEEHDKNEDNFKSAYYRSVGSSVKLAWEDIPELKKGEWGIVLQKYSATRWRFTVVNPQGGSGSSGAYPNAKAALAAAKHNNIEADKVKVVQQEWDPDKGEEGEYVTKKTWMEDLG